ncbi:MAG: type IA DNA topoisomerase, partial [Thermoprotei archaeon]
MPFLMLPPRSLVVAEKNKVAKALANILLGHYRIMKYRGIPIYSNRDVWIFGVQGHILELDFAEFKEWSLSTIERLFNARVQYYVRDGMQKYVATIKRFASLSHTIYLALDNDVEGEHIAWEVLRIAKSANPHIIPYRVRFSSLDPEELIEAFKRPDQINWNWVEKSATRQEVDLRTGVIFTRLLTLSIRRHVRGR